MLIKIASLGALAALILSVSVATPAFAKDDHKGKKTHAACCPAHPESHKMCCGKGKKDKCCRDGADVSKLTCAVTGKPLRECCGKKAAPMPPCCQKACKPGKHKGHDKH